MDSYLVRIGNVIIEVDNKLVMMENMINVILGVKVTIYDRSMKKYYAFRHCIDSIHNKYWL